MPLPSYFTGTIAIAVGATVATFVGASLTGVNARPGDTLLVAGHEITIEDIIDPLNLAIDAWPFGNVPAGTTYKIIQNSTQRVAGAQVAAGVQTLITGLNSLGPVFNVPLDATEPDPSYGKDGHYAHQMITDIWWIKVGGIWTVTTATTIIGRDFAYINVGGNGTGIHAGTLSLLNANTIASPLNPGFGQWISHIVGANGVHPIQNIDAFSSFPILQLRSANGSLGFQTHLNSGDLIAAITGQGYGATTYSGGAVQIRFGATQDWSDTAQGTRISFLTTGNNTSYTAAAEALRIDQDKSVQTFGMLKVGPTADTASVDCTTVISQNVSRLPLHNPAVNANEEWVVQFGIKNGVPGGFGIDTFGTVAFGVMDFRYARGTAAFPSAAQAGDFIGVLGGLCYATTRYSGGCAQMRYYAAENFTDTANGSYISFLTTRNGANAFGGGWETLRLDQDRSVNIFGSLVVNPTATLLPANGFTLPAGPTGTIAHFGNIAGNNTIALLDAWGTGVFPVLNTRFARGTQLVPTAVQSGDFTGIIGGMGFGATAYGPASAQIRFIATQNWTDTAQGARISFHTTLNGSTGAATNEVLRLDQDRNSIFFGGLTISKNAATVAAIAGTLLHLVSADSNHNYIQLSSFGAANVQFNSVLFRQAAGTGAVPSQIQAGAILGTIGGVAYTNAAAYTQTNGQVRFVATENQTATAQGQSVVICGTPNGANACSVVATFQQGLAMAGQTDPGVGNIATALINKLAITPPATSATLTIADGTTLIQTTSTSIGRGQYQGTGTNDNATAGNIGEYRSASNADTGQAQSGATVTMTIANPCVVTWGATTPFVFNGNGTSVVNFTTTGALPTGVVTGTNYYVIGSSVVGNTFQIATSADNALAGIAIITSGLQSGVHTGNPTAILGPGAGVNVAAMVLQPGDYDLCCDLGFIAGSSTSITRQIASLSTTSAIKDQIPSRIMQLQTAAQVPGLSNTIFHAGPAKFNVPNATTLTIYAVAFADFTVSTLAAWGGIRARRVR